MHPTGKHWKRLQDGRIHCLLCPHACVLANGQTGRCNWRKADDGRMILPAYGLSSGLCADPIEKKPLYHFLPGSPVLSFGTIGCNLQCSFCQNASLAHATLDERRLTRAPPETIAKSARNNQCPSVAFTYNEPIVFFEYACDTARACHERGIRTVAVTAGYIMPEPRREFFDHMDAANIDLKAFHPDFYRQHCGVPIEPVLETIEYVARQTTCWLELTTLIIPALNDSNRELDALTRWMAERLGPHIPLHFSAFRPTHRMLDRPPTPPETLTRACHIARRNGLRYVYTGNVYDPQNTQTNCHRCGTLLIDRRAYRASMHNLDEQGHCIMCNAKCAGFLRNR